VLTERATNASNATPGFATETTVLLRNLEFRFFQRCQSINVESKLTHGMAQASPCRYPQRPKTIRKSGDGRKLPQSTTLSPMPKQSSRSRNHQQGNIRKVDICEVSTRRKESCRTAVQEDNRRCQQESLRSGHASQEDEPKQHRGHIRPLRRGDGQVHQGH
jgi:hypothetical protein